MLFAIDYNDKRVHINETQSNQTYYCPFCGASLITKKGDIRQHHFSHSASHRCSDSWENNRSYDMSPWHNEWQSIFPKANQEIKLALGETTHRADVIIDRTVIEFQHSIMPVKAFDDRNSFYFNLGYKVVWLFDLSDLYSEGNLYYQEAYGVLHFNWKNPKKAFNSYDVKSGCIDLFFQLTDNNSEAVIVRVLDVSENGFEEFTASQFISKVAFLRYVGFVDGICALPARDDLEKRKKYNEFCQKFGIVLNKQQERAVQAVEGANLILAVPGSGKTTVLISRLGHMIFNKGISPDSILAITFNKKAAEEMKERFKKQFGAEVGNQVRFWTINALCDRIYRDYCKNRKKNKRSIINDKERRKIAVDILSNYSERYPSENEIIEFETSITYIKNMMLTENNLTAINESYPNIKEMYLKYTEKLKESRKMDFDDQMVFANYILKKEPDILNALTARFKYICVDEAQDTSKIQHDIIKMISKGNNLFMVGDEDQSIYGFRGAYPKALLNFRYDYTNPYIMRMEKNYRSTTQIVEMAQLFVSANKGRYEKNMTSERGPGEDVHLIQVISREEQYSYLLSVAKNKVGETAFLYRDNDSSVVLIDLMLREKIPFKLKSPAMNFFGTRVILDIIAYLKLALDDRDYESLCRICYKEIPYLKTEILKAAVNDSRNNDLNVFEALEKQPSYIGYIDRVKIFRNKIKSLKTMSPINAIYAIIESDSGRFCKENNYDSGKVEILKILAKKESKIESFLGRIQFLEGQMQKGFESDSDNPVILSTIHSSKGMEFNTVYLFDVYDGQFPSSRPNPFSKSKDNANGEQEERRLFFVGLTRAKNSLYLFSIFEKPSSYIKELFPNILNDSGTRSNLYEMVTNNKPYGLLEWRKTSPNNNPRKSQADYESHQKELEERRKREEEEHAKLKELEDQRCHDEVLKIINQQDYQACDTLGRRWIRCEKCGEVKLDKDFSSYGGSGRINLGVCSKCARSDN